MAFKKVEPKLFIGVSSDLPKKFKENDKVFLKDTEEYFLVKKDGTFDKISVPSIKNEKGIVINLIPEQILKHL